MTTVIRTTIDNAARAMSDALASGCMDIQIEIISDTPPNIKSHIPSWATPLTRNASNVTHWSKYIPDPKKALQAKNLFKKGMQTAEENEDYDPWLIPDGEIITTSPSMEKCIEIFTCEIHRFMSDYEKRKWVVSSVDRSVPREQQTLRLDILTHSECAKNHTKVCDGFLSEGFTVAHLNSNRFECPECSVPGQIGWIANSNQNATLSYKDAVCTSCKKRGTNTVFEIKTRNESSADRKKIYGGSFSGINNLYRMKANVYMIVVARDSGKVRIGKVQHANPSCSFDCNMFNYKLYYADKRVNNIYPLPKSVVYCESMDVFPVLMTPLNETLTPDFCQTVSNRSLELYNRM